MATVMSFTSPADEFPLGTVFSNLPDVTVELERIIPDETRIVPYFWVRGADAVDMEAAFDAHEGTVSVTFIDSVEDEFLMRAEWDNEYYGVLSALAEANVTVLSGVGTKEGWRFEVRSESREGISAFRDSCQDHDLPIEITAVHALLPVHGAGFDLTDPQREALVAAYEGGYFDSPRSASLADIADDLDITQQSLSSRLRRGHGRLVANTLITS